MIRRRVSSLCQVSSICSILVRASNGASGFQVSSVLPNLTPTDLRIGLGNWMYWISCQAPAEVWRSEMSEAKDDTDDEPVRKGKSKLLLVACVLALVAGGGGFYSVYSGLLVLPFIGGGEDKQETAAGHGGETGDYAGSPHPFEPGAFVHLEPLIVTLGPQSQSKHLKITLAIEVGPGREAEVEAVMPRVIDILNGFLRAVDEREFELPRSMERLRAQMLRRVRLVTPDGAVRDLLIQEFVLI